MNKRSAVVGAGVALLLAPESGRGLREDLTEQVNRLKSGVRVESREDGEAPADEAR